MKSRSHLPSGRRQCCPINDFKGQGSDLRRHLVSAHDSVMKGQEKPVPRLGRGRRVDAGRGDVVKLIGDALGSEYQDICGRKPRSPKPPTLRPITATASAAAVRGTKEKRKYATVSSGATSSEDELPDGIREGLETTITLASRKAQSWNWSRHQLAEQQVRLHRANRNWVLSGFVAGCDFVAQLYRRAHIHYHDGSKQDEICRILDAFTSRPALHSRTRVVHMVPRLGESDESSSNEQQGSEDKTEVEANLPTRSGSGQKAVLPAVVEVEDSDDDQPLFQSISQVESKKDGQGRESQRH